MKNNTCNFKVPLTRILKIENCPNSDRLSIATVYGFQVIVGRNQYKEGDLVYYVPIDSILDEKLETILFPKESKVVLHGHRVRQIRLRGYPSQGLLVDPGLVLRHRYSLVDEEDDASSVLGVSKYEPPAKGPSRTAPNPRNKARENSRFHKFNGVENLKWYPNFFDGQEVVIQTKLHGSNCRAAYLQSEANTIWKKILQFFRLLPKYEYVYGSNNVQLQERKDYQGFYGGDVYGAVLEKVNAFNKLKPGETVYGELIGVGIQANYHYGYTDSHHFVLYDVKKEKEDGSQEFLNPEEAESFAKERGFDFVPVVYRGVWDKELAEKLSTGPCDYYPKHSVKEGVVVKSRYNYGEFGSKKAYKIINPEYLDNKTNTDNH